MRFPSLKFGTDGWRAVIGDEFTFVNVRRVSHAVAAYARALRTRPHIVVGFDTRFLSQAFGAEVAATLTSAGCRVTLSAAALSTPALTSAVVSLRADGGVMLTASHNPARFNGYKFKVANGSSAPETVTSYFERHVPAKDPGAVSLDAPVVAKDLLPQYLRRISSLIDLSLIRRSGISVVADPLYGAARGYLRALIGPARTTVEEIHDQIDPLFGGLHPEPIEQNLDALKSAVRKRRASVGLATDGDADRLGVVDDTGRYLTPHQVFPLILWYLCARKGLRGKVIQALSLGFLSERVARDFSLPFEEVPIGFKYIASRICDGGVLLGGEESGGYGYGNYLPERDGVLNSLVIMEMLAETKKPLSVLIDALQRRYGTSSYLRTDFVNPGVSKSDVVRILRDSAPDRIAGVKVAMIKDYDGIEFVLEDGSWLLLRPSGTEPVIRVYAEAAHPDKTRAIIAWGNRRVRSLVTDNRTIRSR